MAFIFHEVGPCDEVTFYMRKNFRSELNFDRQQVSHFIERGDSTALIYYIKKYMDTNIKSENKRPDTPMNLIMPRISKLFEPLF